MRENEKNNTLNDKDHFTVEGCGAADVCTMVLYVA